MLVHRQTIYRMRVAAKTKTSEPRTSTPATYVCPLDTAHNDVDLEHEETEKENLYESSDEGIGSTECLPGDSIDVANELDFTTYGRSDSESDDDQEPPVRQRRTKHCMLPCYKFRKFIVQLSI